MSNTMVDVMLHIDESLNHEALESIRDDILSLDGVMAASYHDDKSHLMIVEYDPDSISSSAFLTVVKGQGAHAELVGL